LGRIISQKNKSKVIRAFRTPSAPVVMSLMALILVIAAPALVSSIDDSYNQDILVTNTLVAADDTGLSASIYWNTSTPVDTDKTYSTLIDGNNVSYALSSASSKQYVGLYKLLNIDPSVFSSISKLTINTSVDLHPMSRAQLTTDAGATIPMYGFTGIFDANNILVGYEKEFSSYEKTLISGSNIKSVGILLQILTDGTASEYAQFEINPEIGTTIPYAEIIVGATGALLIVCAILATPWVGTTGLTIKKRRSA